MATNIKTSSIKDTYDRIVLIEDSATISTGTSTVNIEIQTPSGTATATPLHISTERFGIGTDTPQALAHLESTDPYLRISDSNSSNTTQATGRIEWWDRNNTALLGKIGYLSSSDLDLSLYNTVAGKLKFFTNDTERMTILSDGKVGIGTTDPGYALHVKSGHATNDTNTGGGTLALQGTDSTLSAGTQLGTIYFLGSDTTYTSHNTQIGAKIVGEATADWDVNDVDDAPTELQFWTCDNDAANSIAQRMVIDRNGKVGIGITAPEEELHVEATDDTTLLVESTGSNSRALLGVKNDAQAWVLDVEGAETDNFRIRNGTAGTTTFSVMPNGNIGIGTATPGGKNSTQNLITNYSSLLEIAGTGGNDDAAALVFRQTATTIAIGTDRYLGKILFAGNDVNGTSEDGVGAMILADAGTSWGVNSNEYPTELQFWTNDATSSAIAQRMVIDKDGKVGIGVDIPLGKVHIESATAGAIAANASADELLLESNGDAGMTIYSGTSNTGNIFFGDADDDDIGKIEYAHASNNMSFICNASTKMTILDTGEVGIGTAGPGDLLEVKSAASAGSRITINTTDADQDCSIQMKHNDASKWIITSDYSDTHALTVLDHDGAQGVKLAQNDGDGWGTVSDERWKTEWTEYSGALEGIKTLRAGKYKFKNLVTGNIPDVWNSGLIAQDVEKILPDCVYTEKYEGKERKGLTYQAIIPYLVKAVQELSAKVEALETKDTETATAMTALADRITVLESA